MRIATLCVVSLVLCASLAIAQDAQSALVNVDRPQATPTDMTNAEMAALEIAATLNRYGCYLQPGQLTDWNGQQVPIVRVVSWYITWGGVQVPPDDTVMFNVRVSPAPGGEAWLIIKPTHQEGTP